MHARAPALLLPALAALVAAVALVGLGALTVAFTDYEVEALPAVDALRSGDLHGFAALLPAYGGSLVVRAPFALLPDLWGGGELAVYRALAVPCLLAGAALGLVLFAGTAARDRRAGWLALGVCAANPLTLRALEVGHPEELLGAALCAGAILAALRDRPLLAGALLGLALANKAWAVLAIGPMLLALGDRRPRALAVAILVAAPLTAPMLLGGGSAAASGAAVGTGLSTIFQPWQVWWFAGHHGEVVRGLLGIKPDYRTAPGWLGPLAHPLVVLVPLALTAGWAALRRRPSRRIRPRADALALLALCFALRCVLDPWNTAYYALPMILALAAWERTTGRTPWLAAWTTAVTQLAIVQAPTVVSPDAQAALYLSGMAPVLVLLARRLLAGAEPAQAMTVSSLGSPLSTSWPSSVTSTRSSIRTPTAPGT